MADDQDFQRRATKMVDMTAFRSSPSTGRKLRKSPTSPVGWGPHVPAAQSYCPDDASKRRERFRKLLVHRYHTLIRAWTEMDPQLQGRLGHAQFLRACREVGLYDEARKLWEALDHDRSGFISLYELDQGAARLLESFAISVWAACGSVHHAWDQHFNKRGLGRCTPERFIEGCKEIGFQGDVDGVYNLINKEQCTTSISIHDFEILKMWFANKKTADKVSAFHPHVDQETAELRAKVAAAAKTSTMTRVAGAREVTPKDKFKRLLLKSYGNYVRAWREGLDRDRNGRLDYEEFRMCCSDIGYPGPRKEVWNELDVDGSGVVSLGEIDRATADLLEQFYATVMNKYSTWREAWSKHFDHKGLDRVEIQDFRDGCVVLGYGGNVEKLFDNLDTDRTRYLSYEQCAWIAGGESPDESPLWESVGDFKITGQFKKITKSQQRRMDQRLREQRLLHRAFEARNRTEIQPDPDRADRLERSAAYFKEVMTPKAGSGLSGLNLSGGSPNASALMSTTDNSFFNSGSLSDTSPKRHRFAHSAARYYDRDLHPGPPPPSAPAAPVSPYRKRLDGRGNRVPWRPMDEDFGVSRSTSLPNFASTVRSDPGPVPF